MMRGSDIILEIPKSGTLFRIRTYLSWNNFGMIYWSDGFTEPHYDVPVFARHPGTGELFWPHLCKEVRREVLSFETHGKTKESPVPYLKLPSLEDFDRTAKAGRFPGERPEAGFRRLFWWIANRPERFGESKGIPAETFRQNLEDLLAVTPVQTPGREWMEIEIHRELGDFGRALHLLDQISNADGTTIGRCLRRLLAAGNSKVAVVAP